MRLEAEKLGRRWESMRRRALLPTGGEQAMFYGSLCNHLGSIGKGCQGQETVL